MNAIKVFPIGKIENENDETKIFVHPAYRAGLKGLGGIVMRRFFG